MDEQRIRARQRLSWIIGQARREMAEEAFVSYRGALTDHTTFLRLEVLVPVCTDCWLYEAHMEPDLPHITPDGWQVDLLLMGFPPGVLDQLEKEIAEGVGSERGPFCHYCGIWLPYWEYEDGCFTQSIPFEDYFGFKDIEHTAVSKALRKRIAELYGQKCFSCGRKLKKAEITIDHIVDRVHGGTSELVNIQLLCDQCNNSKGDVLAQEKRAALHFPMRPVPSDAYEGVTW